MVFSFYMENTTKRKEVQQLIQERTQTDADVYFFQVNLRYGL